MQGGAPRSTFHLVERTHSSRLKPVRKCGAPPCTCGPASAGSNESARPSETWSAGLRPAFADRLQPARTSPLDQVKRGARGSALHLRTGFSRHLLTRPGWLGLGGTPTGVALGNETSTL